MTDEWGGSAANEWGDDAAKWASEFLATAIDLGYSNMDEGWLIGWFANAIEMSSGKRLGKSEREIAHLRAEVERLKAENERLLDYVVDLKFEIIEWREHDRREGQSPLDYVVDAAHAALKETFDD